MLCSFSVHAEKEKFRLYMPEAFTLIKNSYRISGSLSMFNTSGYYDENGAETAISGNNSFQMVDTDLSGDYGISERFQFGVGLKFRSNESSVSGNATSNSGIESYFGRGQYYFYQSTHHHLAAFGEYREMSYVNKRYSLASNIPTNDLVLGDGGNAITVGGIYSYRRNTDHTLNLMTGYMVSGDNDLSSEVVYRLDSAWAWDSWAFIIGGRGVYSMQDGTYSGNRANIKFIANGATSHFNATDRQYFEPLLEARYAFNSFRVGAFLAQRMNGQNTDAGTTMGLNITLQSSQKKKDSKNKLKSFKEYNVEASIIKVSPRGKFVQIDKGLSEDIVKGMEFDIYETDYFGKNVLVAEAFAYEVAVKKSILKITKKIKNVKVKTGFTVRGKQGL